MRGVTLVLIAVVTGLGLMACTSQESLEQEIRNMIRQEVATALTEVGEGSPGEADPSLTQENLRALINEAITDRLSEQGLQGEQGLQAFPVLLGMGNSFRR